jgi:heme-degrading monooxygenase HmoA
MYARINEVSWSDEESEDEFNRWRDLIREQSGFRGYLILDKGNRQELAITLWDTREAHHAWADQATFRHVLRSDRAPRISTWTTAEAIVTRAEFRHVSTTGLERERDP